MKFPRLGTTHWKQSFNWQRKKN